jgi:dCMP deaminase
MRVSWDTYYMNLAEVVKTRSLDPKTKVGSVLVSLNNKRIISTGYNSIPAGLDDNSIDWSDREYIHTIIIHSEMNSILYANSRFEDSVLYSTLSPCCDCMKLLSCAKIKKVIYKDEYKDITRSKELALFFGIEMVKYRMELPT